MRTVTERLALILNETGWSQAELARRTRGALSQQGLNKIITGSTKSPSADALAAIAKATGYSLRWLVSGKGAKHDGLSESAAVYGEGVFGADAQNAIAQALEDAIRDRNIKLGAAEKVAFIAAVLKKLAKK